MTAALRNDPDTMPRTQFETEPESSPVLIVDDDRMYTLALRRYLKSRGIPSIVCHDISQALSLPAESYRAAVVDVFIQGDKDGLRLVRRLLSLQTNLPIIVISGNSSEDVRDSVLDAGASHFLAKPFRLSHLLTTLEHLVGLHTPSDQHTPSDHDVADATAPVPEQPSNRTVGALELPDTAAEISATPEARKVIYL